MEGSTIHIMRQRCSPHASTEAALLSVVAVMLPYTLSVAQFAVTDF